MGRDELHAAHTSIDDDVHAKVMVAPGRAAASPRHGGHKRWNRNGHAGAALLPRRIEVPLTIGASTPSTAAQTTECVGSEIPNKPWRPSSSCDGVEAMGVTAGVGLLWPGAAGSCTAPMPWSSRRLGEVS